MDKKYICCLCGEEVEGFGNNPDGALDVDLNIIEFTVEDRCCNACNMNRVIPGRLLILKHNLKRGNR